ncbi:Hypothetical protein FP1542 [Flavobacterium psychrophilum JIP02/86]|uniref:Uncharacterized protein n=1 Tax=Flavobacterium psychrophilum (strain ATCC 49511 / DSM 21280 / CIP 103535 / JIP02/86) TaxID=402612 RepID=A6GZT7_FLAPJ|nr:hypothetical protein [Flavobacterium psychrophilum]QGS63987.1 hypothetical protein GMY06_09220 [Flavobacterium psychrophilum]CAL43610.1 Hypothetical protein FP1542 [Flavobacterium psychrophilum JIP02/86]
MNKKQKNMLLQIKKTTIIYGSPGGLTLASKVTAIKLQSTEIFHSKNAFTRIVKYV